MGGADRGEGAEFQENSPSSISDVRDSYTYQLEQLRMVAHNYAGNWKRVAVTCTGFGIMLAIWAPVWLVGLWVAAAVGAALLVTGTAERILALDLMPPKDLAMWRHRLIFSRLVFVVNWSLLVILCWFYPSTELAALCFLLMVGTFPQNAAIGGALPQLVKVELIPKVTISVVVALALAIDSEGTQATFYLSMMVVTVVAALFALRLTKDISNGTDVQIRSKLALQQSMERAQAADRAKSVFLGTISHEIRTPLSAVLGMCELLKTARKPETRRRYLKLMSESGESLLQLLNDILDLSLAESGDIRVKTEAGEIRKLTQTAISMIRQRAEMKGARNSNRDRQ